MLFFNVKCKTVPAFLTPGRFIAACMVLTLSSGWPIFLCTRAFIRWYKGWFLTWNVIVYNWKRFFGQCEVFQVNASFREQSICVNGNCSFLSSRVYFDHLYVEFLASDAFLPLYAWKNNFRLEKNYGFILWFLKAFVCWNDIRYNRRKINISCFAWLIIRVYAVVMTKIHFRILRFFLSEVSVWSKIKKIGLIRPWIFLTKRTLGLSLKQKGTAMLSLKWTWHGIDSPQSYNSDQLQEIARIVWSYLAEDESVDGEHMTLHVRLIQNIAS